jgi:hypothetical protein
VVTFEDAGNAKRMDLFIFHLSFSTADKVRVFIDMLSYHHLCMHFRGLLRGTFLNMHY